MRLVMPREENYIHPGQDWPLRYRYAHTQGERWQVIREVYEYYTPAIFAAAAKHRRGRIDPYFLPWQFTPIEAIAWDQIRMLGTPLYPQVPVDRVFLDFANPYYKIGLELDGAEYHDRQRDLARDEVLLKQGWHIYRIKGFEIYDPRGIAEEVITAIDHVWFDPNPERWADYDDALITLGEHTNALWLRPGDPDVQAWCHGKPQRYDDEESD